MANNKDKKQKTKVSNGYSGYRYLNLNGQVIRRLVYVFDTIAFVMPDEKPSFRMRYSRDQALIVRPSAVHLTQVEATKGEFATAYMVKGDGADAVVKKVQVKGTGTFREGRYYMAMPNGETRSVHGMLFGSASEAQEFIVQDAEGDLKRINDYAKSQAKIASKLEKFLKKQRKGRHR